MDNVKNCGSYINIISSQTYRPNLKFPKTDNIFHYTPIIFPKVITLQTSFQEGSRVRLKDAFTLNVLKQTVGKLDYKTKSSSFQVNSL
jgi:hypothetical protein